MQPLAWYVEALRGASCGHLYLISGSYMDMPSGFPKSEACTPAAGARIPGSSSSLAPELLLMGSRPAFGWQTCRRFTRT